MQTIFASGFFSATLSLLSPETLFFGGTSANNDENIQLSHQTIFLTGPLAFQETSFNLQEEINTENATVTVSYWADNAHYSYDTKDFDWSISQQQTTPFNLVVEHKTLSFELSPFRQLVGVQQQLGDVTAAVDVSQEFHSYNTNVSAEADGLTTELLLSQKLYHGGFQLLYGASSVNLSISQGNGEWFLNEFIASLQLDELNLGYRFNNSQYFWQQDWLAEELVAGELSAEATRMSHQLDLTWQGWNGYLGYHQTSLEGFNEFDVTDQTLSNLQAGNYYLYGNFNLGGWYSGLATRQLRAGAFLLSGDVKISYTNEAELYFNYFEPALFTGFPELKQNYDYSVDSLLLAKLQINANYNYKGAFATFSAGQWIPLYIQFTDESEIGEASQQSATAASIEFPWPGLMFWLTAGYRW